MMNETQHNQIISIIENVDDMTIATQREDGFPQATTVSFVNDGLTIYFITTEETQKFKNIKNNNKVSMTINRNYSNWNEIEGLSLGGIAKLISDPDEQERIGNLLIKKFPQAAEYEDSTPENLAFVRIDPIIISILDYNKGFGHTELININ